MEQFILNFYEVTGGASIDHGFSNVTITVLKKGYPNGYFGFEGTVSPNTVVDEPATGTSTVFVPIRRYQGDRGTVRVGRNNLIIIPVPCFK